MNHRFFGLCRSALAGLILSSIVLTALGEAQPGELFTYDAAAETVAFSHAPLLENTFTSAVNVSVILATNQAEGRPLAVRMMAPATDPAALGVFDNFPVEYVFCDAFGGDRVEMTKAIGLSLTASVRSKRAFVGNFNVFPNGTTDTSFPQTLPATGAPRFELKATNEDYKGQRARTGREVAMPNLMPGTPDFRNPASGNSNAPNIRSACFILPIQRITLAQLGVLGMKSIPLKARPHSIANANPAAKQLVPIISRFNNFGNPALDSDGNPSNGYTLVSNAANPANGQLLSRGDFSALVLHFRMRGADSTILFSASSVVGYSSAQIASDALAGWNGSTVANEIFTRGKCSFANLKNTIGDQGAESDTDDPRSTEQAGAAWSGIYDRAGATRRLVLLVSNLGSTAKVIDFPKIGGRSVVVDSTATDQDNFSINAGAHHLLTFTKVGVAWELDDSPAVFLDNNRNGVGLGVANPP